MSQKLNSGGRERALQVPDLHKTKTGSTSLVILTSIEYLAGGGRNII